MTENEAFEHISNLAGDYKCFNERITHQESLILYNLIDEIQQYRAIGTLEEVRMLKDYKELYDVYKLIGTIEEFRNLKYKKNVLPIATIEFSKEDMQKIVDEKVAQIELDIQEIRAKVIDEFAEALKEMLKDIQFAEFQGIDVCPCYKTGEECPYINQDDIGCQYCAREQTIKEIDEIAEQLKAGGKNG